MSDDQNPFSDTMLFYIHVGKLVDLAAVSFLAALKHHKMTQMHRGNRKIDISCYEIDEITVELPESIDEMLCELSDRMDEFMAKWWRYHWNQVFFREMPSDDMITLFDQLVWLPNGSISFEQTARKLLDGDKLTNVQKFQIACTYCFIDDVNRLKKTLSPDEMHLATESLCWDLGRDLDPFLEYWHCKIRLMTDFIFVTNKSINYFFTKLIEPFSRKYYNHCPVVEYFWKRSSINEEERLRKAKRIICSGSPDLIRHFLPLLTSSQFDSLIKKNDYEIMLYFTQEPKYIDYTMLTWKRVVNVIDDDSLNRILCSVTVMQKNRDYVNGLLREMWLYMSEQQKTFIANQEKFDYVAKWFIRYEGTWPNYELIFDVFMLWDSERRHKYWNADWTSFVVGQMKHKNKIEEMMKIIFDSNENIAAFKRTFMTDYNCIRSACEELLKRGRCEELQNYLNFCTEDQDVIRNLKKQIVTSIPKYYLFYFLYDCYDDKSLHTKFEYFLRDIFTVDEIKDFQKDVIMGSLQKIEKKLRDGSVHEIIRCIEKYLSSEEDLYRIKLHFIKCSRSHYDIEVTNWVDFLSWCLDCNNSLTKRFKSSLQPAQAEVSDEVEMKELSIYESFCDYFLSEE